MADKEMWLVLPWPVTRDVLDRYTVGNLMVMASDEHEAIRNRPIKGDGPYRPIPVRPSNVHTISTTIEEA